jgi:hypothetical protein
MSGTLESDCDAARSAPLERVLVLLHDKREAVLGALLENPGVREIHVCLLLGRKDLSSAFLESIASRDDWMRSYRVRRGLAFHPHVPHLLGLRLARELHAADLVALTFLPSGQPAVRQLAQDLVLARLPQLSIAEKTTLARRGPSQIVGALLADGSKEVLSIVLDSPRLTEGHVLKALSRTALPRHVVEAIAGHGRWSNVYSVRLALIRNSQAPLARVVSFLPVLSTEDLRLLNRSNAALPGVRPYIARELAARAQRGRSPGEGGRSWRP